MLDGVGVLIGEGRGWQMGRKEEGKILNNIIIVVVMSPIQQLQ